MCLAVFDFLKSTAIWLSLKSTDVVIETRSLRQSLSVPVISSRTEYPDVETDGSNVCLVSRISNSRCRFKYDDHIAGNVSGDMNQRCPDCDVITEEMEPRSAQGYALQLVSDERRVMMRPAMFAQSAD